MMDLSMTKFTGIVMLDSPGCSVDCTEFNEGLFSRKVTRVIRMLLEKENIAVYYTHVGDESTSIEKRIRRANIMHKMYRDSFLVAVKVTTEETSGWQCSISNKSETCSLATYLGYEADKMWKDKILPGVVTLYLENPDTKKEREQLLQNVTCTSVVTQNFPAITRKDQEYLNSVTGINEIAVVHFKAIMSYIIDTYR